jgi:hypothetical protein
MVDVILSRFIVDDFDGETAILWEAQGPFTMMEGMWTLRFDSDDHTWEAASYEDENDSSGTVELTGTWDDDGHMFY